jgi:hypothetical protein
MKNVCKMGVSYWRSKGRKIESSRTTWAKLMRPCITIKGDPGDIAPVPELLPNKYKDLGSIPLLPKKSLKCLTCL